MAAAASVALRRLASGPGSGRPSPSEFCRFTCYLSFALRLLLLPARAVLSADAQKVMEGKEVTDNARAHQKSGELTQSVTYEEHFVSEIAPLFEGARLVAVV
eukprot:2194105-Pleurochrysis_carterae.AAC.1